MELFQQDKILIHGLGSSGEGVGRLDNYTVFVDGALPGEEVQVCLEEVHKRYARAKLLTLLKASPERVEPVCPLFGTCGGCQLMHLSYAEQLKYKRQRVVDALSRIGHIRDVTVEPCLPSPSSLFYRNKIQLPVAKGPEGLALGLYAKSSHDLIEVESCMIHSKVGDKIYQGVRALLSKSGIEPYDKATGSGNLRHVLIRTASQEALVILVTRQAPTPELILVSEQILALPGVKGVVHNRHGLQDNVILGKTYTLLAGQESIAEVLLGLTFKVSPASFFQVNPDQAKQLYSKALEIAGLDGTERVLDAYCGVGTLSLLFAQKTKEVIGVESVPEAIADAIYNARQNKIDNVSFTCAPAETFIDTLDSIDLVLLNPPRKGCDAAFLKGVLKLAPKKVIYISCDPATLARDLGHLPGYQVKVVQPFDMFPQTSHVETLVLLEQVAYRL